MLVLDSSATLAWIYTDETTESVREIFEMVSDGGACVPSLWRLEIANSLQTAVRKRRIDSTYRDQSLSDMALLNITIDGETNLHAWTKTVYLADKFGLTPYDAAYLELALRRHLPLATLDKDLRAAAAASRVKLLG